jgi:L-arabinokinase
VYEHARSRQFVEAFSRGIRNDDRSAFVDAGNVMNASHWSCGQRCGMGSAPANSLVNALRKAGPAAGIFGSRIAGQGCGGMVAVLAEDSPAARQALEDSLAVYTRAYNVPARILTGSLAGAMVSGAVRV